MNERIQALVERATSRPHRDQGIGGEPTHIYPGTFSAEKFAQLIIAECMDCAQWVGQVNQTPVEPINTAHAINKRIKQHFGVEE